MKQKVLLSLVVLSSITVIGAISLKHVSGGSRDGLKLTLEASKGTYKLGEKLDFLFTLSNTGEKDLRLMEDFGTGTGYLHLECSTNGKGFSGCSDPSWGRVDGVIHNPPLLKSGGVMTTSASVLWNWKSQDIPTYRFLRSGTYYVKSLYIAHVLGEDGRTQEYQLRSEPIKIEIEEPTGEDLEVWNKIKDDGNFAYLTQFDEIRIPTYKTEERAKFMQKVEDVVEAHPNSFYAEPLRQSMAKFAAAEAERQEMIKQMSPKSP